MPSGSSSLADTPAAPTAACTARDTADVVRRLEELIQSIEDIAPLLSWATLQVAVNRLRSLADASGDDAHDVDNLAGSPLHPVQLSFTGMNVIECSSCSEPGDEHSVAGSFGSLDNGPAEAELGEDWEPLWDNWEPGGSPGDDPRAEAAGFGELAFDDRLWSGGPLLGDSIEAAAYAAAAAAAADNDDPNVGESPAQRDPRLPGPGRDALGLDRHGRRMYCDYHDLGGGDVHACAAVDMLQQRAISQLIAKLQRQRHSAHLRAMVTGVSGVTRATRRWWHGNGQTRWAPRIVCACAAVWSTAYDACSQIPSAVTTQGRYAQTATS